MTRGLHLTSRRRPISGRLVIALELTGMSLSITRGGRNAVYAEAMHQFSVRSRDVLMNAQCPHKWWSMLKSAVFGSSSDSSNLFLLGRVVVWSVSRSGRQICCLPILMESSPGIQ